MNRPKPPLLGITDYSNLYSMFSHREGKKDSDFIIIDPMWCLCERLIFIYSVHWESPNDLLLNLIKRLIGIYYCSILILQLKEYRNVFVQKLYGTFILIFLFT